MEDVLREVIVIPDDDEDDDGSDEMKEGLRIGPGENKRESSVEYISEADMQVQPIDYSNITRAIERGGSYSPESDAEIQYLGRNQLRHGQQVEYDQRVLDRMGIHRQRVYKEALDRRRQHPENPNILNDHLASSGHDEVYPLSQPRQNQNYMSHPIERGDQALGRAPMQARLMPVAKRNDYRADPYSNARDPEYILEEQVSLVQILIEAGAAENGSRGKNSEHDGY